MTAKKWAYKLTDEDLRKEILREEEILTLVKELRQRPANEQMAYLRDELRKSRNIIKEWQKFAARLSKYLKCGTMTDDIELAVKICTGHVKVCRRCGGNKVILQNTPEAMTTITCPDCKGSGLAKRTKHG